MTDTRRVAQPLRSHLRRMLFARQGVRQRLRDLRIMTTIDRAHLVMLADTGVVDTETAARLLGAIKRLRDEHFAPLLDGEAVRGLYFLYEDHLIAREGPDTGGVLQTARSRNDLQATLLLFRLRKPYCRFVRQVLRLIAVLVRQARRHQHVMMPIYTHGQVALPGTLGHYYAAAALALSRDLEALLAVRDGLQTSPLGAGAVGGTDWPIDTARTAALLGFDRGPINAIDAIASRDIVLRLLAAIAIYAVTTSRLAADLWLWSTSEFGFLRWPDDLVGISSAMPQKRNPFVLEHVRGRGAAAFGAFASAALAMQATPFTNTIATSTEATAGLWPALRRANDSTVMLRTMIEAAEPDARAMERRADAGFAGATALAERLVREAGLDFRRAHALVGGCVREAVASGRPLTDVFAEELASLGIARPSGADRLGDLAQARGFGGGPGSAAFDEGMRHLRRIWRGARRSLDRLDTQWTSSAEALECAVRQTRGRTLPSGTLVYAFCTNTAIDPVASRVLDACFELVAATSPAATVDGLPALECDAGNGIRLVFVRTARVVTDAIDDYLPQIERHWPDVRLLAAVNWHEGAHAPDRVITVHTTGDPSSGEFAPADPLMVSALMRALDRRRVHLQLHDWQVMLEATHHSGALGGESSTAAASFAAWCSRARPCVIDIEIGSRAEDWCHPPAASLVAHALVHVFDHWEPRVVSLLGLGGVHCDPVFRDAVIDPADRPYALTHVIPNRALASGDYASPSGLAKLRACVRAIRGGVEGILCHESVKAGVRARAQELADELHVPLWRHHAFRARRLAAHAAAAVVHR